MGRRRGGTIALCAVLAAVALPASAQAGPPPAGCAPESIGGEWRSYGHDYSNTRDQSSERVISTADVSTLTSAWTFSSVENGGAGDFTGTPIVADGCMYVGSTRGWVFAVNADTGKLVWRRQVPYGGTVNGTLGLAQRTLPVTQVKSERKRHKARHKTKRKATRATTKDKPSPAAAPTAGTIYVAVTRLSKAKGCPPGDPCVGPYVVALDQATGEVVWATPPIDSQPGADVYGSPVIFDGVLMLGVSGGSAELGNEADRYAFQGSMNFLDASSGGVIKKTWTIHPPKQPDDQFAGAGIWSTPAIDTEEKLAYVGAGNPFKPQAEHPHADAILKLDVNRASPSFGEIIGSYKGVIDEYVPAFSQLPCFDIPGNPPPYYPQGIGQCGDIDLDFGAAPNLFRDKSGRKLVGEGQKSGVYHVVDAATMKPVWTQVVGPPTSVGGIVGSTAVEDGNVFGPITVPGYVWSLSTATGSPRWVGPIGDGAHWGPPVTTANGVVYSVDASGFLNAFDARQGVLLAKRPLQLGGGGPLARSWGGVSVARNTVYAAVGVVGLADGFVAAFRRGGPAQIVDDLQQTNLGGGGGGGGGPAGPSILAGPAAANTGYATPVASTRKGGPLSFVNLDVVLHDVTSDQKGPDGTPLFRSKLIGLGESAPIEGLDKVEPGKQYGFFCSVHPGMRGTLAVQ
jgi:polyvinyl alcohol dehydrogenase (cytochrome)